MKNGKPWDSSAPLGAHGILENRQSSTRTYPSKDKNNILDDVIIGTEILRDQNNNVFLNQRDFSRVFKYLSATGNAVKVTDWDV